MKTLLYIKIDPWIIPSPIICGETTTTFYFTSIEQKGTQKQGFLNLTNKSVLNTQFAYKYRTDFDTLARFIRVKLQKCCSRNESNIFLYHLKIYRMMYNLKIILLQTQPQDICLKRLQKFVRVRIR